MTALQTPKTLTEAQISLLRLFSVMSPIESNEIIDLVHGHLQEKLNREVNRLIAEKGYTQTDYDNWLSESNRTETLKKARSRK